VSINCQVSRCVGFMVSRGVVWVFVRFCGRTRRGQHLALERECLPGFQRSAGSIRNDPVFPSKPVSVRPEAQRAASLVL